MSFDFVIIVEHFYPWEGNYNQYFWILNKLQHKVLNTNIRDKVATVGTVVTQL